MAKLEAINSVPFIINYSLSAQYKALQSVGLRVYKTSILTKNELTFACGFACIMLTEFLTSSHS